MEKPGRARRWLVRLAQVVGLVALVCCVGLVLVGVRCQEMAATEAALSQADALRERAPAKPPPPLLATDDGGALTQRVCVEGVVFDGAAVAPNVAVSAAALVSQCPCATGCDCPEAVDALFRGASSSAVSLAEAVGSVSDQNGHFQLCGLAAGDTSIWAEGASNASAQIIADVPCTDVVLHLVRGQNLRRGRVVDRRYAPIRDAEVLVLDVVGGAPHQLKTDAAGAWAVEVAQGAIAVAIRAEGFVPQVTRGHRQEPMLTILEELVTLTVHVVDHGNSVEGAEVTSSLTHERRTTDARGECTFVAARLDDVFVARHGTGLNWARYTRAENARGPAHLGIELHDGFTLTGTVRQGATSARGATLTVTSKSLTEPLLTGTTDAEGQSRLGPLPPGDFTVTATLDDCSDSKQVSVVARDTSVSFNLDCDGGLRGRVVTRQGKALEGATVNVNCGSVKRSTTADVNGSFAVSAPRGVCELSVNDSRVRPLKERVTAPRRDVLLVTDEAASVTGRVVHQDGRPAPGVRIQLISGVLTRFVVDAHNRETPPTARTDGQGAFRVSGVAAGQYVLIAGLMRATAPAYRAKSGLVVNPGATLDVGTLVLDQPNILAGTVRSTSGEPLAGVLITPDGVDEMTSAATFVGRLLVKDFHAAVSALPQPSQSDIDGHFQLVHATDVHHFRLERAGYLTKTIDVDGHTPLDVRLERSGELMVRGRVSSGRKPVTMFSIDGFPTYDLGGAFEHVLRPAALGQMSLLLTAEGYHDKKLTFTPRTGAHDVDLGNLELDARDDVTTTVTVRDELDKPVPEASVTFEAEPKDEARAATANDQGVAEFTRQPVRGSLVVERRGYAPSTVALPATATTANVVLTRRVGHLEGTALALDGSPAAGAVVKVGAVRAIVDDVGHFSLDGLDESAPVLVVLQTPVFEMGRTVSLREGPVVLGRGEGGGALEVTLGTPATFMLMHAGDGPADAGTSPDGWTNGDLPNRDFFFSRVLEPGTHRISGLRPGAWQAVRLPFSERGLMALFAKTFPPKVDVQLLLGATARLSFD